MAIRIPVPSQKLLVEMGLVPPNCSSAELLMPASGPMVLRYEVWVTPEHLEKLSVAFTAMVSELKANDLKAKVVKS